MMVLGLSGVRPAAVLSDGRKIHLVPDSLTRLSLAGALSPVFQAGPGLLDAQGEAQGRLDLSSLPHIHGQPIWIAAAVLDPAASQGIAYLPDPYVFRIP